MHIDNELSELPRQFDLQWFRHLCEVNRSQPFSSSIVDRNRAGRTDLPETVGLVANGHSIAANGEYRFAITAGFVGFLQQFQHAVYFWESCDSLADIGRTAIPGSLAWFPDRLVRAD